VLDLLSRAASAPRAEARTILDSVMRAAGDRLWVARSAARLYKTHVGDSDAARYVIDAMQPLTCIEWRLVSAAFSELGDRAAAGKCLERAATNARTATDLCIVALGYRDAGYEDEAQLLVDGAIHVATHAMDAWTVACCLRDSFGDAPRGLATLRTAMRDASGVGELLAFARALAAHDDDPGELVMRAASLASTVQDWLDVARARHLVLLDPAAALLAVDHASRLSVSPQDERTIAIARGMIQIELLDDERPKLPPSKLLHAGARSFAWDRDPNRLLAWLRARIPRSSIDALSRPAVYFFNDDLVTLLDLQKTGNVPHPLPAQLDALRDHVGAGADAQLRAFACALLCIDAAASANPEPTQLAMVGLVESCTALGGDALSAAAALFAALADSYEATQSATELRYLMLHAEVGLALCAATIDPSDPRIAPLVMRVVADADYSRDALWRGLAELVLPPALAARL
jgi:hypothetical protein